MRRRDEGTGGDPGNIIDAEFRLVEDRPMPRTTPGEPANRYTRAAERIRVGAQEQVDLDLARGQDDRAGDQLPTDTQQGLEQIDEIYARHVLESSERRARRIEDLGRRDGGRR